MRSASLPDTASPNIHRSALKHSNRDRLPNFVEDSTTSIATSIEFSTSSSSSSVSSLPVNPTLSTERTPTHCTNCGQPATPEYTVLPGFWSRLFLAFCCPCIFCNCCSCLGFYEKLKRPAFICPECRMEAGPVPKNFDPSTYPHHFRGSMS